MAAWQVTNASAWVCKAQQTLRGIVASKVRARASHRHFPPRPTCRMFVWFSCSCCSGTKPWEASTCVWVSDPCTHGAGRDSTRYIRNAEMGNCAGFFLWLGWQCDHSGSGGVLAPLFVGLLALVLLVLLLIVVVFVIIQVVVLLLLVAVVGGGWRWRWRRWRWRR